MSESDKTAAPEPGPDPLIAPQPAGEAIETSLYTDTEGLLTGATCRLFGRRFDGLQMRGIDRRDPRIRQDAMLARIYGFTWQGNYYKLAVPTVMVVNGGGRKVGAGFNSSLSQTGIEFKDEFFSEDVLMWVATETDFAVRIDITSGFLSEVLIAPECSDASNMTGTGDGTTFGRSRVMGRANLAARSGNVVARPPNS